MLGFLKVRFLCVVGVWVVVYGLSGLLRLLFDGCNGFGDGKKW